MKIIDLLKQSAAKYPDKLALKDNLSELSYCRLLNHVNRLSCYLTSIGCQASVKVAIILPNSSLYFVSFFAISAAKATIVPLPSKATIHETVKFIKKADISIAITNSRFAKNLKLELKNDEPVTIVTIRWDNSKNLKTSTLFEATPKTDSSNEDVALMVCTSATTGPSKIVMLTDYQLISNMMTYKSIMAFNEPSIVYCSLQLHHIYSICAQILTHISLADTFIVTTKPFFIKDFFTTVQKHKVTITAFVPYMAILMSQYKDPKQFDTSSLKYITLSGAKTPAYIYKKLTKAFTHIKFINTYGMSEAGSRIAIAAPNPENFPPDSVGKPMPSVKIRITNRNQIPLPPNHTGEIEVKSSGVFKGYFRQPQLTQKTLIDGWLKTGDLGKLDDNGNLFILGRKKQTIVCGGDNIYPTEIEECLTEHPSVSNAAIIAMSNERLGEVPIAFVVKNKQPADQTTLIQFCQKKLSGFKIPVKILFIDKMPMLDTSKINRCKLKKIANQKVKTIS